MYRNNRHENENASIFGEETLLDAMESPEECGVCGAKTDEPVVFVLTMCQDHGSVAAERGMKVGL